MHGPKVTMLVGKSLKRFAFYIIGASLLLVITLNFSDSRMSYPQDATLTTLGEAGPIELVSDGGAEASQVSADKKVPFAEAQESNQAEQHIAMIFDEFRISYALALMRSIAYHSLSPNATSEQGEKQVVIVFHAIAPTKLHQKLQAQIPSSTSVQLNTYDYDLCLDLVQGVMTFSNPKIHPSAHCKLFLSTILPEDVDRVLYIDNDVTAVAPIIPCYQHEMADSALLGMVVDMGDVCQLRPNECWPIGFEWELPANTVCGNVPEKAKQSNSQERCPAPGQREPLQFNGGVILMDLETMRRVNFVAEMWSSIVRSAELADYKKARWGEQDYLNALARERPEWFHVLECGCNYQFSAIRRELKCPKQRVILAHGWTSGLKQKTGNPYNQHFYHFLNESSYDFAKLSPQPANFKPNEVALISGSTPSSPASPQVIPLHAPDCPHQDYKCASPSESSLYTTQHGQDPVFLLTRTARRPWFFKEMRKSVTEQSWFPIGHVIMTDDPQSRRYIEETLEWEDWDPRVLRKKEQGQIKTTFDVIPSRWNEFNPKEACKCQQEVGVKIDLSRDHVSRCSIAPPLPQKDRRQKFLDCFCSTGYPMNSYMTVLHDKALSMLNTNDDEEVNHFVGKNGGWILYLDDDNVLLHKDVLTLLMAKISSTKDILVFRSMLGRLTPSNMNWGNVVMGDIDASAFFFHSSLIPYTQWGTKRCGDFWTLKSLTEASGVNVKWINDTFVGMNPLRGRAGGLGLRQDSTANKVTVIITSHAPNGYRPQWLLETVRTYAGRDYEDLVDRILVVWNNPDAEPPKFSELSESERDRVIVLPMKRNSLNNRWTETIPHIKTTAVLNFDDDMYITRDGLLCLLSVWLSDTRRLVGPYVRVQDKSNTYLLDELTDPRPNSTENKAYTMVLPRALMLHKRWLEEYRDRMPETVRNYVDTQEAHCDDIALNAHVNHASKLPPVRVALPAGSIVDFFASCHGQNRQSTGGLALQRNRATLRSECLAWIRNQYPGSLSKFESKVATCGIRGIPTGNSKTVPEWRFKVMRRAPANDCSSYGKA